MTFDTVEKFEQGIAEWYGAPCAVATDSCTHALELCLRYKKVSYAECPSRTYLSVPMTFMKLNIDWEFNDLCWSDFYYVTEDIIDSAVYWKQGGYIKNTLMCLSFQYKKHLRLGRGGMILCGEEDKDTLKKMSYDGRDLSKPWSEQSIDTLGYHYYMTPETAQEGLKMLWPAKMTTPKKWSYLDYPNITELEVFK